MCLCELFDPIRISDLLFLFTVKDNGLHLFGAHHSTYASPSEGSPVIIFNDGISDQIFTSRANNESPCTLLVSPFDDLILCEVGILSPEVFCIMKENLLIRDRDPDRFI